MPEANNVQKRILNKATKDPSFAAFIEKLEVNVFEGDRYYETTFNSLVNYYREHKTPATKDVLETYLDTKLDRQNIGDGDRVKYKDAINDIYTVESSGDGEVFDEIINDYIYSKRFMYAQKTLALEGATPEAMDKFDKTYSKIKKEYSLGSNDATIDFTSSDNSSKIADLIRDVNTGLVTIPVKPYQEATGGLGKGEMGIIAADTGAGKSLAMVSMAVEYVLSGKNIMYVDLEERPARKFMRFYKAIMGRVAIKYSTSESVLKGLLSIHEAEDMFRQGGFSKLLAQYSKDTGNPIGNLHFSPYQPHTLTTSGLRQAVENLTMVDGNDVDIIFVDYPDLLRLPSNDDIYRATGIMFEELRAIAQEYNVVMWTASQLNRKSKDNKDIRTGNDIQGSIQKKNSAEFVAVINLKDEEREMGFGRIYVDKNRNGNNTGDIIRFKVDNLTGLVREETETEVMAHDSILANKESNYTKEDVGLASNVETNNKLKGSSLFG